MVNVAGLLGDHRVEVDLQQQVAELLAQVRRRRRCRSPRGSRRSPRAGSAPATGGSARLPGHSARSRRITSSELERAARRGRRRSRRQPQRWRLGQRARRSAGSSALGVGAGLDGAVADRERTASVSTRARRCRRRARCRSAGRARRRSRRSRPSKTSGRRRGDLVGVLGSVGALLGEQRSPTAAWTPSTYGRRRLDLDHGVARPRPRGTSRAPARAAATASLVGRGRARRRTRRRAARRPSVSVRVPATPLRT